MKLKKLAIKQINKLGYGLGLNRNFISAVCYHSISNSVDKYSVSLGNFKKQMEIISQVAEFIDVKKLANTLKGGKNSGWNLILTIDDGYEDVESIIPFTEKLKIPVILFVLSQRNKVNRKELNNSHKLLSLRKIKKLHKLGWTIGSHSATHADLSLLNDKDLVEEIVNSKKSLERNLGVKVDYFAYPKGVANPRILAAVKKAGYKFAFTTTPGIINSDTNPLLIPRTVIDKSRKAEDFPDFLCETVLKLNLVFENFGVWKLLSKFS